LKKAKQGTLKQKFEKIQTLRNSKRETIKKREQILKTIAMPFFFL